VRCRDVFGRLVYLTDAGWREIASLRVAVANKRETVEPTLGHPDMVTQDREGSARRHFYKRSPFPPPYERGYIKVTTEPSRIALVSMPGLRVIDVALVSSQPAKEIRIWPKPKPGQLPM
jgi:hypothetical protein